MRHSNKNRILGRTKRQKVALISGLAISLFKNESIKTTEAKAKASSRRLVVDCIHTPDISYRTPLRREAN